MKKKNQCILEMKEVKAGGDAQSCIQLLEIKFEVEGNQFAVADHVRAVTFDSERIVLQHGQKLASFFPT